MRSSLVQTFFPYLRVRRGLHPKPAQHLQIPRRALMRGERRLHGNGLHGGDVRACRFVADVGGLQVLPVARMGKLRALIAQIAVPVRVEIQQHAARLQNAHPLRIGLFRVMQVPCDVPRDQHVKDAGRKRSSSAFICRNLILPASARIPPRLASIDAV